MEYENPSLAHTSQAISINREKHCNKLESCECVACSDFSKSHQPTEVDGSRIVHRVKQAKSYSRKIQTTWCKKYPWITVCSVRHKIFCRLCCSAKQQNLSTRPDRYSKSSFVIGGFANWKKGLQKFLEHESSDTHREAVERLSAKNSSVHIGSAVSQQTAAETAFHRTMLMKVLSCTRYLGLALRGHDERPESFEGNLYQLLLLEASGDHKMKAWLEKREYISPDIINDMIMLMGTAIRRY